MNKLACAMSQLVGWNTKAKINSEAKKIDVVSNTNNHPLLGCTSLIENSLAILPSNLLQLQ